MKECAKCKQQKTLDSFYADKGTKDGKYSYCNQCCRDRQRLYIESKRQYMQEYRKKNPEKIKQWRERNKEKIKEYEKTLRPKRLLYSQLLETKIRSKNNKYKRLYGITVEESHNKLEQQKGLCGICLEALMLKEIYVDHDHQTGKVRGVVHRNCNTLLGFARDDKNLLQNAINYLKSHEQQNEETESNIN